MRHEPGSWQDYVFGTLKFVGGLFVILYLVPLFVQVVLNLGG